MHLVFELIASMNEEESGKTTIKTENRNRNDENRRQIIDFIADNGISDAKTVSKAIGLKPSKTRDYLKQLVDMTGFCGPTAISKTSQLSHQKTANCHIKIC